MWEQALYDLRRILSELYLDATSAKRIASDAGIPIVFIDWTGDAASFWSQVVRQGEIRGGLRHLIDVVLGEYGEGEYAEELRRIRYQIGMYRGSSMIPHLVSPDPKMTDSERLVALEIQVRLLFYAVGGLYLGLGVLALLILLRT